MGRVRVPVLIALIAVGVLVTAPIVRSAGRGDGFPQFADEREPERKPAGWVGECHSCEKHDERAAEEGAPGGGDPGPAEPLVSDVVYYDEAVPPPEVLLASYNGEEAEEMQVSFEEEEANPAVTPDAEFGMEERKEREGTPLKMRATDLQRGEFIPLQMSAAEPHPSTFDPTLALGQILYFYDDLKDPMPLYVQEGFATVILLTNGEQPTGALCGSCGPDALFVVEELSGIITIKPRIPSSPDGVVATNLQVLTDTGRVLTFNVIEISGTNHPRTDRVEIRKSGKTASPVASFTFPVQLAEATREVEENYDRRLQQREATIVSERASEGLTALHKFKVEEDADGKELTIDSIVTIGDETIIRMHAPKGNYMRDPIVSVQWGRWPQKKEQKLLQRKSTLIKPVGDQLEIVVTLEAVQLEEDQKLVVSLWERGGQELRSSAKRS